jgi:phospholipid/cholesterol/gamma-HCH transport system permease protein
MRKDSPLPTTQEGARKSFSADNALPAHISHQTEGETLSLVLAGRLDAEGVAEVWDEAIRLIDLKTLKKVELDLAGVDYLDIAGASLVTELQLVCKRRGMALEVRDLAKELQPLLQMFVVADFVESKQGPRRRNPTEEIGRAAVELGHDVKVLVAFVGEMLTALWLGILHPRRVRWKDFVLVCETAGVNALPIIALIGFLMGLIMAFQSAVQLRRFGADIFVANMLTISMVRELGPLVSCILLAGRSGSAFAAEIGTMKVNEEVNALTTMGLDPVRFLAVPRVFGAMAVIPILTMFFNFFALLGGAVVLMSFGFPFVTYVLRVQSALQLGDLWGGMFKAVVFGLLVAGIGCQRGLTTGTGASAVGASTTSSVVSGLVLIAVADGILAVLFYALKI